MKSKILVVDDEPDALEILGRRLSDAGFATVCAADGLRALESARVELPDLIVLDLMLPGLDGFEVCRLLRRDPATAAIPIIFLTARADEMDRIVGLELGAEDYVTKPFSPRELVLRIKRTLLRTTPTAPPAVFTCGDLTVDMPRHEVTLNGERVLLTATEFKLLEVLVQRAGFLQSRAQLLKEIWNYESDVTSRTVDTHMRRLREKLREAARHLETVRGVGYRFVRGM
ncbi:MAG: response regulator transcription factor [Verrucomicrobiota bacterium]